ncbi:MAG: response regulator [bacterium]|nr:response regulator [bacterium]
MAKKILLIDDNENVRATLRDIFKNEGYAVIAAARGEEAMDVIDKEKPDLILLDTVMDTAIHGSMDGFEVCRQIKKVKELPVRVIIYTGTLEKIDAVKARRAGADDYIIKGEDPGVLVAAVKKLLGDLKDEK